MYALTLDQRGSRSRQDAVPMMLEQLNDAGLTLTRNFERTAGDEVQGLIDDAANVMAVVATALHGQTWWVGIGVGGLDLPLPESVRASRGAALVAARQAVDRAKRSRAGIAVETGDERQYLAAARAEAGLRSWAATAMRRTELGWRAVEAMRNGSTQKEVARQLGISPQTLNRRLGTAGWADDQPARDLCAWLLQCVETRA